MTTERYRIVDDAHVYFVTFSVVDWLPVFISDEACRIITDSLRFCHDEKGLRTNAYVIMPTHMHAICFDEGFDNEQLRRSLTDFRKFTGRLLERIVSAACRGVFSKHYGRLPLPTANGDFGNPADILQRFMPNGFGDKK